MRALIKFLVLASVVGGAITYVKLKPRVAQAHLVDQAAMVFEVMGTGTLEARVKTIISPRIQERLDEVLVDQGDNVKAGQLLARLNDVDIRAQIEVSTATLAAAQASVERVASEIVRTEAIESTARLNYQRVTELLGKQMIAQESMDKALEQLRIAEADVKRSHAALAEARAGVTTAEKSLAYQQQRLDYTHVTSPYDGLVARRDRDPGGVVVPGGTLMLVIATNELWVSAWFNETHAGKLREGQPARVVFRSDAHEYVGSVARLGRETDRETREFLVDVKVEQLPPNWTLGQRAEVFVETGRAATAVRLPAKFLIWQGRSAGVFVESAGVARWTPVEIGHANRDYIEVVAGVSAGQTVLLPGDGKPKPLVDGQLVKYK